MPIFIVAIALAAAAWLGYLAAAGAQYAAIGMLGTAMVGLFAFFSPRLSLVLLVFSMQLSPELGLGGVGQGRDVVVRYDDILLIVIFLSWFARTAINKTKPFITSTPVQTPVLLYIAACVLSTGLGVIRGDIDAVTSFFYVLKYVEYFLLFFMTVNLVESRAQMRRFLLYGLVVAVLVTVYAYYYYYSYPGADVRATGPFEVPFGGDISESEPASLGGYYLIIFGVLFGLLTEAGGYVFFGVLALLLFMFPAFLLTFSRASYIGFAAMLPALFLLTRKRRLFLLGFITAVLLTVALIPGLSNKVANRITMTYKGVYATETVASSTSGDIKLEESAAARVRSLRRVLYEKLPAKPLFGWGVTGIGMGDTQYALVLGEVGIVGTVFFIWMLVQLFKTARVVFSSYDDPMIRAVSMGFMVSLIGLLFQSLGVNTFIIVRIMEPFWFIAALLSVLYMKAPSKQEKIRDE